MDSELLAERWGFEPQVDFATHTRFPSVLLKPLGHLSKLLFVYKDIFIINQACFYRQKENIIIAMAGGKDEIICLKSLSKRYGIGDAEYYALKDINLSIKSGEFVVIMGPSGCGKTTLLNILGLLDKATTGEYIFDGDPVEKISKGKQSRLRSSKIGFIFQSFNLIPNFTVIDNVALPLVYCGFGKSRRHRVADKVLQRFHLNEREYYMPYQLSGGQQQRVAIARSLVNSPSIILADEPTGNLDSRSSHIVMEELKEIHSQGNTIIMVTHNANLTTYATRVINMLDGTIFTDLQTVSDKKASDKSGTLEVKKPRRRTKARVKKDKKEKKK